MQRWWYANGKSANYWWFQPGWKKRCYWVMWHEKCWLVSSLSFSPSRGNSWSSCSMASHQSDLALCQQVQSVFAFSEQPQSMCSWLKLLCYLSSKTSICSKNTESFVALMNTVTFICQCNKNIVSHIYQLFSKNVLFSRIMHDEAALE